MPKPLTLDLPFPSTDKITPDALTLRIISPEYASASGELTAVLQYIYQSFFFKKEGYDEIADTLEAIAIAEMIHFKLLGETVLALGAAPIYTQYPPSPFNFYSTKYVTYSRTLKDMLEDDIRAERHAIRSYENMLRRLKNQQVSSIIERLLQDEKLHLQTFTQILEAFKS
ncbi:MAG: manganese catalase family protein [Clostridiales bacterium]|nr:manganese catalase family protein [Clostridiales bacterium]